MTKRPVQEVLDQALSELEPKQLGEGGDLSSDLEPQLNLPKPFRYRTIGLPMVRWYDPSQLIRTAVDVVISTIFGRSADYRLMEALALPSKDEDVFGEGSLPPDADGIYDYSDKNAMWIDYIADTGDGWDST